MKSEKNMKRLQRLKRKVSTQMDNELENQIQAIREGGEYLEQLEPFLERLVLAKHPATLQQKVQEELVLTMCIQAPLELFQAAGVQPFKLVCGLFCSSQLITRQLPPLTCPMLKSVVGMLNSRDVESAPLPGVFPTTCDWVVKFPELTGMDASSMLLMELPHTREGEKASKRWLEEVYELKRWLEKLTNKKISTRKLRNAVDDYLHGYEIFAQLISLRRKGRIPAIHFAVIANSFSSFSVQAWSHHVKGYAAAIEGEAKTIAPIFLAGSPIHFPNYKMLRLIENAGMTVVGDDLCSMERVFPGPSCYQDTSEHGLLEALAERHHKACTCPTFADNHRRFNSMLNVLRKEHIKGVVFHVLKGCHPYDIEAVLLEEKVKEAGFRFMKIETDYVLEDEQNIVTRLEAFKQTIR